MRSIEAGAGARAMRHNKLRAAGLKRSINIATARCATFSGVVAAASAAALSSAPIREIGGGANEGGALGSREGGGIDGVGDEATASSAEPVG